MTREEAARLLPNIQAFAEGEEVQFRAPGFTEWLTDPNGPTFNPHYEWRIKPKPREVWIAVPSNMFGTVAGMPNTDRGGMVFTTEAAAMDWAERATRSFSVAYTVQKMRSLD